MQSVLHRLVNTEGINTNDIIVLTPSAKRRSRWKSDQMLGNFVLTWDMDTDMHNAIRVSTIYRFKGLESAVVILTEMDQVRDFMAVLLSDRADRNLRCCDHSGIYSTIRMILQVPVRPISSLFEPHPS